MDNTNKNKKRIAVLGYHKIGQPSHIGWSTWSYVSESTFNDQLDYLKNNNWKVLDREAFIQGIETPEALPEKSVLITFDDGYESTLKVALPILQKFSYPAIIFVPTAFVGFYNAFDADIMYEPKETICNWNELQELNQNNIAVESHGNSHAHFSELTMEELVEEVVYSKRIFEDKLNKQIKFFSFPYGDNGVDRTQTEKILIEAGYTAAFLYGGGPFDAHSANRFSLSRVPIGPDTNMNDVLNP